jgi:hypothetical protein
MRATQIATTPGKATALALRFGDAKIDNRGSLWSGTQRIWSSARLRGNRMMAESA